MGARDAPCPIHIDQGLVECGYGDWTGRPLKELAKDPLWKVVQAHPSAVVFPGPEGEALRDTQARAVSAVRDWNARLGPDATSAITLPPAFAPLSVGTVNRDWASSSRPAERARRSIGTCPTADTRFGSSNIADTAAGACLNCTYEMPLGSVEQRSRQSLFFLIRGAFLRHGTRLSPKLIGGSRLRRGMM